MKKYARLIVCGFALISLVACKAHHQEIQSSRPSTEVSSSKKESKDNGQKDYQPVLERYTRYISILASKDKTALEAELKKIDNLSGEYELVFSMEDNDVAQSLRYAFTDLNKDGQDELLIGDAENVSAIYYLKEQKPDLLQVAYVASAGGHRSSLTVYENGQVSYASWQSIEPNVNLTLYSFSKDGVYQEKETTFQLAGEVRVENALGIAASRADLSKLDWKNFATDTVASTSASEVFQVRVEVSDLRIRKTPSTSGEEVAMISKGIYTITETVAADGYTWGKLESGQGWISIDFASRVDRGGGNKDKSLDRKSIFQGDFSTIAGEWNNSQGEVIRITESSILSNRGKEGSIEVEPYPNNSDLLLLTVNTGESSPYGSLAYILIPAGNPAYSENGVSDSSKNRLIEASTAVQAAVLEQKYFYYKD